MVSSVGVFLRSYRHLTGLTQAELAEVLGVNQATVSRLEQNNTTLARKHMVKLLQFLRQPFHDVASILDYMPTTASAVALFDQRWCVQAANDPAQELYGPARVIGADIATRQTREFARLIAFYEESGGFDGTILGVVFDSIPSYSLVYTRTRYLSGTWFPIWHAAQRVWWVAAAMGPTLDITKSTWNSIQVEELIEILSVICPTVWTHDQTEVPSGGTATSRVQSPETSRAKSVRETSDRPDPRRPSSFHHLPGKRG